MNLETTKTFNKGRITMSALPLKYQGLELDIEEDEEDEPMTPREIGRDRRATQKLIQQRKALAARRKANRLAGIQNRKAKINRRGK